MRMRLAALLALLLAGAPAWAQDTVLTGTLKTINARGTILIGYREGALPFSFLNKAGQPIGFSVDLCHAIAHDVAAALSRDLLEPDAPSWQSGVRIVYVPVAADARLPKLIAGQIDLECGSTTANAERAKQIAFSPVFFMAGTKLMTPVASSAASYRDLGGHTIVAGSGTTNLAVVQRLASTVSPPIKVSETPTLDAAYAALASGQADAFASDDILLAGFLATRPDGAKFHVVGDFLSFEPYAIGFRRDDPAFAAVVQGTFQRLAADGSLVALYNRWLVDRLPTGETLNLPMNAYLAEIYRSLSPTD